jgi:pilus assembly protein CpaB
MMPWTTWMKNRQARLGAAAVLVGAVSFWLAHRYLRAQEQAAQQRVAVQYQTREVVVAATDVAAGAALEPAMLAKRAIPERFLASDALTPEAVGGVAGRRVLRALRRGETLTGSALESALNPALSSLIEPGLRAITIPVDESSAAAGLLAPGDLVDLLLVTRDAESAAGAAAVRPLLQAVRVVATGKQTSRIHGSQRADELDSAYATLTLHVRPEEAERILLAQRIGELAVVLRTALDTEAGAMAALNSEALLGGPPHRVARARSRALEIEYIIGGTGAAAVAPRRAALRRQSQEVQP